MADTNLTRSLPAPKTFAPSREDVLSTLAFFFGDPAVPEKLRDYSEHHAMTYHFPDACAPRPRAQPVLEPRSDAAPDAQTTAKTPRSAKR